MAAGAAGAAAAIAKATKASGVLVRLDPEEFAKLLIRVKDPLIVIAEGGFFSKNFQYLVSAGGCRGNKVRSGGIARSRGSGYVRK